MHALCGSYDLYIAWKGRPRNDLYCVGWDVKPYSLACIKVNERKVCKADKCADFFSVCAILILSVTHILLSELVCPPNTACRMQTACIYVFGYVCLTVY